MKLISCHIENFGHLRNYDHIFAEGLNVFLHENGWGKSTLASFLCAMFYGMPGARKRKTVENEREKFRPWQGGTYGGRLLFETDGRIYEMIRTFGRRASEDTFELRDAETNLPDFAFSSAIGQELFALDRESFLRTAMTGQQDCTSYATDSIQALLADLSGQTGDLGNYDDAMKRLSDAAAALTPKRRSGSLYRRAEEIRLLEREAAGVRSLEERIRTCETKKNSEEEREKKLEEEIHSLEEELETARRNVEAQLRAAGSVQADAAAPEIRRRLRQTVQTRQKKVMETTAVFPGRIPARTEVEEHLRTCRSLEKLEVRMQEYMLSEEEQDRLTKLEELLAKVQPEQGAGQNFRVPYRKTGKTGRAGGRPVKTQASPLLLGAGAVLLAAGILLGILVSPLPGCVVSVAGAAVLLASCADLVRRGGFRRYIREENKGTGSASRARHPLTEGAGQSRGALQGGNSVTADESEYERLIQKEQQLENTHAQWAEMRRPVLEFLRETGFVPEEDLRSQLEEIRDAADDYEDARHLLQEAEAEADRFEKENGGGRKLPEGDEALSGLSSRPEDLNRLHRRLEEAHAQRMECRERISEEHSVLEELQAEQEELEASAVRLEELQAEQAAESAVYRRLLTASASLQSAKESLTARYADPVRRNFAHYWEQIASVSAAGVYVDANTEITVEELGKQRELSLFSAGFQDLAGICLRIALMDAMYPGEERPPLILDDPFTALDDEKIRGAMRLLQECAGRYQILYFTCSRNRCG